MCRRPRAALSPTHHLFVSGCKFERLTYLNLSYLLIYVLPLLWNKNVLIAGEGSIFFRKILKWMYLLRVILSRILSGILLNFLIFFACIAAGGAI
jgi:hypothetical protein